MAAAWDAVRLLDVGAAAGRKTGAALGRAAASRGNLHNVGLSIGLRGARRANDSAQPVLNGKVWLSR